MKIIASSQVSHQPAYVHLAYVSAAGFSSWILIGGLCLAILKLRSDANFGTRHPLARHWLTLLFLALILVLFLVELATLSG